MTINLKFKPNDAGGINVEFDIKTSLRDSAKEIIVPYCTGCPVRQN